MLYYTSEVAPEWGSLAIAIAARALELGDGEEVIRWGQAVGEQREPLLGVEWECEYYVDLGARSARALRGGAEGFVLKGAVLERCERDGRIAEIVLHPAIKNPRTGSLMHLFPVVGGERLRQAAVYLVELGLTISLARRPPRGRALVVRHGALLQQIASYFNKVYDIDCSRLRSLLLYAGLSPDEAREVEERSKMLRPEMREQTCNAGLAVVHLLAKLKEEARHSDIVAVAEDLSRTRYLSLLIAAKTAAAYSRRKFIAASLFMEAVEEAASCLSSMGLNIQDVRYEIPMRLEEVMAFTIDSSTKDPVKTLREAAGKHGFPGLIESFYRGQLLDRLGVASDVEPLFIYRYLYGPREASSTPIHDKGELVEPPVVASFNSNKIGEHAAATIREADVSKAVKGFKFTYIIPDPTPTCSDLAKLSRRLGPSIPGPQTIADLVKVRPPVKLELVDSGRDPRKLVSHIYTQARVTLYGVPAPLIVVDQRSRVTEWDASTIRSLLETLSRRVVPYSTFIRDFSTRRKYMT